MTLAQEAANQNTSQQRLRELATLSTELARLVANNSNADGELLRYLRVTSDYITRKNLAQNPNTPQEVLIKLAWQFPQEVLDNTVFEQTVSDNSNLLKRFSKKVLLRLIQQDRIPVSFLEWVAEYSDKRVLLTLLTNPNIPISALDKLSQSQELEVVDAVKLHVNWRQEFSDIDEVLSHAIAITDLEKIWDDEYKLLKLRIIPNFILPVFDDTTRLAVAKEPYTPAKILTQLIRNSDKHEENEIKIAVAEHPNTPKNILENLLGDESEEVSYAAANNPNISLNIVQEFYHQYNAVLNPNTSSEILSQFAHSRWKIIRSGVAHHQNTPANILEQFAVVDSLQLRLAVAFNLNTPIHVFEQLIQDNYWEVRWAVAQNLSTPAHILEQLLEDTRAYVREIAEERLDTTNETAYPDSHILLSPNLVPRDKYADDGIQRMHILSEEISLAHKAYVQTIKVSQFSDVVKDVKNGGWCLRTYLLPSSTPIDILQQLADSQDEEDRRKVASHKHTPVSILAQLAIDESKYVRREIAGNTNTPVSILEQLALDEAQEVRRAIASNSNTPISILLQFINENNDFSDEAAGNLIQQNLYNLDTPATLLQQLSEIQNQEIAIAVGRHPNTPVNILEQLANAEDWKVRQSITQNPSTPVTTREALLQDENIYVRNAAASNISDTSHLEQSTVVESQVRDVAPKTLKKYAQHSTPTLSRLITFFHPQTPAQFLAKNFRSPIWLDRYAIAQNSNTARHIVQKLTEDGNQVVRNAAISNLAQYPILTNEPDDYSNILLHLPSLFRGEALSVEVLEQAFSLSSRKILLAVANHPSTPKNILEKLTSSQYPKVVKAARLHVNLAGEINDAWNEAAKLEIKTSNLVKNIDELEELAEMGVIPNFIIEQLFEDEQREIHVKLAAYNIPINILQKLANEGDYYTCLQIAKNPYAPAYILEQLAQHNNFQVRNTIGANPNTPKNILEALAQENNLGLHKTLLNNPNTPVATIEQLQSIQQLYQKAQNSATPEAELEVLAESKFDEIRQAVAQNYNTPFSALEKLATDINASIRNLISSRFKDIASNAKTSETVLERLLEINNSNQLRKIIAENPNTSINILERLALEPDNDIRQAVAKNPNITLSILEELAKGANSHIRLAVIKNPGATAEILARFADQALLDKNEFYVRAAIAEHPNTPLDILDRFSTDFYCQVQSAVAKNMKTTVSIMEKIIQGSCWGSRKEIVFNPNTTVEILEKLVQDSIEQGMGYDDVPVAIAKNLTTPISLLVKLASVSQDRKNPWTKANETGQLEMNIAENLNTPINVLEKLAQSKSPNVRGYVAKNPNTSLNILEQLFENYENDFWLAHNPQLPLHMLESLAKNKDAYIRKILIEKNANVPMNILEKLAVDTSVEVRRAVAKHRNTSIVTLSVLAGDTDISVRQALTENPNQLISLIEDVKAACYAAEYTTSESELATLALSPWQCVHAKVCGNPNTSVSTLEQLADDKIVYLSHNISTLEYRWSQVLPPLQALANNPHTGGNVLEKLLEVFVNAPNLRKILALHPNSSINLLEQLATDANKDVRQAVAQNSNTSIPVLENFTRDGENEICKIARKNYLAKYPEGLPLVLQSYAKSSKPNFSRLIVFLYPQTSAKILSKNSRSSSWLERYAIAQNSNTPNDVLQRLINDANCIVRAAARANLVLS